MKDFDDWVCKIKFDFLEYHRCNVMFTTLQNYALPQLLEVFRFSWVNLPLKR